MVHLPEGPLQDDHREDAGSGTHVPGPGSHGVRGDHAGPGVALGWAQGDAGSQRAGGSRRVAPRATGHRPAARRAGPREAGAGHIPGTCALRDQVVEAPQQLGVVVLGRGVDREHARRVTDADHAGTGQLPVDVAGQGREEPHSDTCGSPSHRLVEVGDRPAQRDVRSEQLGQLGCRRPCRRVPPRAERHEQLAVGIEGQVSVHHRRDAHCADRLERDAVGRATARPGRRTPPGPRSRRRRASRSTSGPRSGSPTRGSRPRARWHPPR